MTNNTTTTSRPRRGRPPAKPNTVRRVRIGVRFRAADVMALRRLADAHDVSLSGLLRSLALRHIQQELSA